METGWDYVLVLIVSFKNGFQTGGEFDSCERIFTIYLLALF